MRVFLDANVLFAAAISIDGRCAALLELTRAGDHDMCASSHAIEKARRNINARYPAAADRFERKVVGSVRIVSEAATETIQRAIGHGLPAGDAPILAAAIAAHARAFVTGDRCFGHLYGVVVDGVRVVGLREAIALLMAEFD